MVKGSNFKFVKGQTIFVLESDFYVSVEKFKVKGLVKSHFYEVYDSWGEYDPYWESGCAVIVENDFREVTIPLTDFYSKFISTSSRKLLNRLKKDGFDVKGFDLNTKSFANVVYK